MLVTQTTPSSCLSCFMVSSSSLLTCLPLGVHSLLLCPFFLPPHYIPPFSPLFFTQGSVHMYLAPTSFWPKLQFKVRPHVLATCSLVFVILSFVLPSLSSVLLYTLPFLPHSSPCISHHHFLSSAFPSAIFISTVFHL